MLKGEYKLLETGLAAVRVKELDPFDDPRRAGQSSNGMSDDTSTECR